MSNIVPISRVPLTVRPATLSDIPFIDQLQKANAKMVGWMPTKQLEGKIGAGHVLVAWAARPCLSEERENTGGSPVPLSLPLGYCIGTDRYFKRDDVGIIYQMNVVPGHRRKLVGASLIQALFDRAAYGCKLYCCWCAQDIEANYFWQSLGFIPLAFRTGSAKKARTHIFWQKRIREGDVTTPYWFPSLTNAGAIREDRLVLPIPPGTTWQDAMPLILPGEADEAKTLPSPTPRKRAASVKPVEPIKTIAAGGLRLATENPVPALTTTPAKKERKPKVKNDPAHVAAARELRDRYLEQFNAGHLLLTSTGSVQALSTGSVQALSTGSVQALSTGSVQAGGKYEVTRRVIEAPVALVEPGFTRRALPKAA